MILGYIKISFMKMSKYNKEINNILKDPYNYANKISKKELENILTYLNKLYRQSNKSVVSDEVYDIMLDVLKVKDPKSSFLKKLEKRFQKIRFYFHFIWQVWIKLKVILNKQINGKKISWSIYIE